MYKHSEADSQSEPLVTILHLFQPLRADQMLAQYRIGQRNRLSLDVHGHGRRRLDKR